MELSDCYKQGIKENEKRGREEGIREGDKPDPYAYNRKWEISRRKKRAKEIPSPKTCIANRLTYKMINNICNIMIGRKKKTQINN